MHRFAVSQMCAGFSDVLHLIQNSGQLQSFSTLQLETESCDQIALEGDQLLKKVTLHPSSPFTY